MRRRPSNSRSLPGLVVSAAFQRSGQSDTAVILLIELFLIDSYLHVFGIARLVADSDTCLLVAQAGGRAIGYLLAYDRHIHPGFAGLGAAQVEERITAITGSGGCLWRAASVNPRRESAGPASTIRWRAVKPPSRPDCQNAARRGGGPHKTPPAGWSPE